MTVLTSTDKDYLKYDYFIEWILTDECNFKCSYCFRLNNKRFIDNKKILLTLENIINFSKKHKLKIILTGGEPTILKNFNNILITLLDNNIDFDLNTNGTGLYKISKNVLEKIKMVSVSWHLEYLSEKQILDLCRNFSNINININIVITNKNINYFRNNKIFEKINNIGIEYTIVKDIYFDNKDLSILSELLHTNGNSILNKNLKINDQLYSIVDLELKTNLFKKCICFNNFITIDPNGKIYLSCDSNKFYNNLDSVPNKILCNKNCEDLYAYIDTTKYILNDKKIKKVIHEK